ncbi:hypothetical protein [Mycolicibacterium porcinum]|uniref:hypothetical protein n=1 Tax=Mycolicibacterium porcinum TaxID=39693 RepID=UPI001041BF7A|nr:hypothetical protein [Mycolicibacterium porcinum]
MSTTTAHEYCVHVAGIGFVGAIDRPPMFNATVGTEAPAVFTSRKEAESLASQIKRDYRRLGQPDMVDQVEIYCQKVSTRRHGWVCDEPVPAPPLPPTVLVRTERHI